MTAPSPTLCFTCGLALSAPPRLNQLPNGSPCPACRERLLDALPPLLPGRSHEVVGVVELSEGDVEWSSPPGEERV